MNEEIVFPDSNRIGKFSIPFETLREGGERPMLQALFGLCIILKTEAHESGRGTTYIAASELFQPLGEGEEIPEYRIEFAFDRPFENSEREAARMESGKFGFCAVRQFILRVPPASVGVSPKAGALH